MSNNTTDLPEKQQKELIRQAKGAVSAGLEVHVLRAGEKIHPEVGRLKTTDLQYIEKRVTEDGVNLGVAPGANWLIVDLDCKNGMPGLESAEQMNLPATRTVTTPSGGKHLYYKLPDGVRRIKSRLTGYPGIDFLWGMNNVVLPGSVVDGVAYAEEGHHPAVACPSWLLNELNETDAAEWEETDKMPMGELMRHLKDFPNTADFGVDGAYYDDWLEVGMAIHYETDGSGEGLELWRNWSMQSVKHREDKLLKSWASFGKHGGRMVTGGTLRRLAQDYQNERAFKDIGPAPEPLALPPVEVAAGEPGKPEEPGGAYVALGDGFAEELMAAREWVYGKLFIRGYISLIVGRGGSAKSTLALVAAVAIASGRDLLELGEVEQSKVLLITNEEPEIELRTRLQAILLHFGIPVSEIQDNLLLKSGYHDRITIAKLDDDGRTVITTRVWDTIGQEVKRLGVEVLIMDPLVSLLSGISENDNTQMDAVAGKLRSMAGTQHLSILIVHHTAKSASNKDPDGAARGASSLVNAARVVWGLHRAEEKDLKGTMVPEEEWGRFIKRTDGKSNLSAVGEGCYFELAIKSMPARTRHGEIVTQDVAVVGPTSQALLEKRGQDDATGMMEILADLVDEGTPFPIRWKDLEAVAPVKGTKLYEMRVAAFGKCLERPVASYKGHIFTIEKAEDQKYKPIIISVQ